MSNDHLSKISMSPTSAHSELETQDTDCILVTVFYASKLRKIKTQTFMFAYQPHSHLIVNLIIVHVIVNYIIRALVTNAQDTLAGQQMLHVIVSVSKKL